MKDHVSLVSLLETQPYLHPSPRLWEAIVVPDASLCRPAGYRTPDSILPRGEQGCTNTNTTMLGFGQWHMTLRSETRTAARCHVPCPCAIGAAAGCSWHRVRNTQVCTHALRPRPMQDAAVHIPRKQLPQRSLLPETNPTQTSIPSRKVRLISDYCHGR